MDAVRWKRVERLFQSALDLPPGELDAFLKRSCAGDDALERDVRAMLRSEREAGGFLSALLDRARERRADPQLFAGLVQACRYAGLLDASRTAHERARRLDPTIKTSIAYTSAVVGDYLRAAEEARDSDDPFYGIALALAGRTDEALAPLLDVQGRYGSNQIWSAYLAIILAVTRGNTAEIVTAAETCLRLPFADPEGLFHICVVFARIDDSAGAFMVLRRTTDAGFACPAALDGEPSLRMLQGRPEFKTLRAEVERRHRRAVEAFDAAGGRALLI